MKGIGRDLLDRFVRLAGDRLSGEWVILGGTVLPLLGVEHRVTLDIDIVGPKEPGLDATLTLMDLAAELGLPPEAINQTGAFYLRWIADWQENLVTLYEGRTATIRIPNATLFVLLKLPRLTEADLLDCLEMLRLASRTAAAGLDRTRLTGEVRRLLAEGDLSEGKRARLAKLLEALGDVGAGPSS